MYKIYYNGELYGAYHSGSACYGEYFKQNTVRLMLFTPDGSQIKNTKVTVNGTTMTTDNAARLYFTESYDETKTYNITCTYAGVLYHKENISVSSDSAENIAVDLEEGVAYTKLEYRTPGTYTINIPAGVPRAKTQIAGGGGGGGGGMYNGTGGNGGNGELLKQTIKVTATNYSVVVGAGGIGGKGIMGENVAQNGSDGKASSAFGISARGGGGGICAKFGTNGSTGTSYGSGGAGGKGSSSASGLLGPGGTGGTGSNGWVIIEYGGDI